MSVAHVVAGRGRVTRAQAIFSAAFDARVTTRTQRSLEFMEGAYAALESAASAGDANFVKSVCPYSEGTCAYDAWHAGAEEGRRLWRINGGI